ncbi:probable phosphoglycerate mutase [Haloechinothrix alba]|uniref:Probable phosphoglycerate mutase n=1 Tax=Haloechinothrix alba TaxID=664784 RepID=A0A239A4X1_9PSEU|nr:bifunctional RNase H/acid phosphatase [Haloechinothrix alba]SNR90341.1 probable phosphoglycerate mutase [Haloechinothrix alba]
MAGHVVVEADGGSRGNPGPAGYGAVVLDPAGDVLAERQGGLGTATNNVAEYTGLVEGLRAAAELDARTVDVRMDSKLVVEQMSGRWRIKNEVLRPLAARAAELASRFDTVTYTWIPRGRNTRADALANEAMDEQAGLGAGQAEPAPAEPASPAAEQPEGRATTEPSGQGELFTDREPGPSAATAAAAWSGAVGAPTRLYLLRHGQTAMSIDRRYSGRQDVELTELGVWQAGAAAKRLAALCADRGDAGRATVLSSPLRRAVRTAEAVTGQLGGSVGTHSGLRETDFGDWDGLTFGEASERDSALHSAWLGDSSVRPPGGESFDEVHERVAATLDELVADYAGQEVVVVSHVTPIKTVLRIALAAGSNVLYRMHLDPASISIVEFYPDGNASVRLVNDTSHLS